MNFTLTTHNMSNNTQQLCQHLVPPLNRTITTNQLSSQNYRNGPGEENNSACAILNTSRKKQIYEASNEGSEAGPRAHTGAALLMVSTWAHNPQPHANCIHNIQRVLTLSAPAWSKSSGSEEEDNYRVQRIEVPFKNADYPRIKTGFFG